MSQVYDNYRALADGMIADALAATDSQVERVDILTAMRDALAAFDPPVADVAMPTDPIPSAAPKTSKKSAKSAAAVDPTPDPTPAT